jgi:hypothetical protein
MYDVFINYRTGDEETAAALIERELSRRFGSEHIFRASKSIRAGEKFDSALLAAVRRSSVLIAVMGPGWLDAPGRNGGRALEDENDWPRREIVEAFDCGLTVLPVLVGRKTDRLPRASLPEDLAPLADCQSKRLDLHNLESDLRQIGDAVAGVVPRLIDLDEKPSDEPASTDATNALRIQDYDHHQYGGIGSLVGNVGSIVTDPRGPVHTGSGAQYNGVRHGNHRAGHDDAAGEDGER